MRTISRCLLLTLHLGLLTQLAGAQLLTTTRVANGLSSPVHATGAPGDATRLFLVEQRGLIKVLDLTTNTVLGTPFLDLSPAGSGATVSQTGNERGLLGLVFHPDYQQNGHFYVSYTQNSNHASVVSRYTVTANPDVADNGSALVITGPISQPFSNHNGGCIEFGPDRKLYLGLGDGGSAGDPNCFAQRGTTRMGKMLRLNDDGTVPADNPFVGNANFRDDIWAYGLRNPWRFSFDRQNGDLYIGDVGQNAREELNYVAAGSTGGENYGWKMMEGNNCFSTSGCGAVVPPIVACNDPSLTDPVRTYSTASGCAITGGYVYRGCAIPGLQGTYFYADACNGNIWSLEMVGGAVTNFQERSAEMAPAVGSLDFIVSFGQDALGELYLVDLDGEVYKILPQGGINDTNANNLADECEAAAVVRNGSGCNPLNYNSVTLPVLGSTWTTTITLGGGDLASILVIALGGPGTSPCFNTILQGELLITGPNIEPNDIALGTHNFGLPNDLRLVGATLATQGMTFQPGQITLYNAIDITLGL